MASAGKIYLDAQLNTSNLKKQVTSLGKTLGQMKIKLDVSNYKEIAKTQEKVIENTKKALTLQQAINKQKKIEKQNQNDLLNQAKQRMKREADLASLQKNNNASTSQAAQNASKIGSAFSNIDMSSLVKGVGLANQLTNVLASGSKSLIQGITALTSTIGGALGTALSGGNVLVGQAVSGIVSMLGNMAQIVVNIIKGVINTAIKIIKGGIQIIRKMFNFISELPSFIDKVVSKLGNMSITFKALGNVINYCKNLANQFISIIGQKFSAYSIINFIEESLELGSSLTEQMHILEVVTPSFVAYNEALNGASQYSQYMSTVTSKLGISTINATKYLAGYGSMWKSLGVDSSESISQMSKDMLQLTSDIASFRDMDYEDVFKSLKSVIFGGQTRTGLNLGVDIYVDSMKEYAQSVGKVWDEMSGAEKSALRLEKVMEDLNFMYGDFEKTSYTWANQTRFLKEQLDNLKSVIGENLIMVFNSFLIILNKCLGALSTFSYAINNFLKSMGLGKVLESTGANLSSVLEDETGALNEAADSVGSAGSSAAKEIQRSLLGFDKLNNNLTKDNDSSSGGSGVSSTLNDNLILDNNELKAFEEESETLLTKAITNLKDSLKKVSKFFNVLWEDFNTYFAHPFGEFLKGEDGIPRLINGVADLIDGIDWNKINVAFRRWFHSLEPIAEFFFNVGGDIQEYFINPLVTFWSNNILTGYIDTLTKFNNAVDWEKVRKGINNVLKALEPLIEVVMSSGLWIFQNILEPIGEWFLNSVWPILSEAIVSGLSAIQRIWDALKPSFEEFYKNVLVPFGATIGNNIISILSNIINYFNGIDTKWIDELKEKLGVVSEPLADFFNKLSKFDLGGAFDAICKTIETADEQFGITSTLNTLLGQVFDAAFGDDGLISEHIIPRLKEALDKVMKSDFVQITIPNVLSQLVEVLAPTIFEIGCTLGEGILQGITSSIMGADLTTKMGNIGYQIDESDMNEFSKFISHAANGLMGLSDKVFNTKFIDSVYDDIYESGTKTAKGYTNGITYSLENSTIPTSTFLSNNFGSSHIMDFVKTMGNETRDNYVNGLDLQNVDGSSLVSSYSTFINNNMSTTNETIKTSVDNASTSIINETKSAINSAINSTETQASFQTTGENIGSKIANAIKSKLTNQSYWKSAFSQVTSVMNGASNFYEYSSSAASATSLIDTASVLGFANGGYVHATPGGVVAKVAEAGDNEWILPDKKLRQTIREESGNGYGSQVPIILQLSDGSELGSWLIDLISHEVKRTGKSIF